MSKKKKEKYEEEITVGKCIVCEEQVIEHDRTQCNSQQFIFGYGSQLDMYTCRIFLCDRCAVEKLAKEVISEFIDVPSGEKLTPADATSRLKRNFYNFKR